LLKSFQILGYSAGIPNSSRGVSSVIVSTEMQDIMIDCGEGTYLKCQKAGYLWKRLSHILITHMHPDHTGGLVNFLFYRKLLNVTSELIIVGPPELSEYLNKCFSLQGIRISYPLHIFSLDELDVLKIKDDIQINFLEMEHGIRCWAYKLSGKGKKLVFVTDTRPNKNTLKLAHKADILIHEATFNDTNEQKAYDTFHTTVGQAIDIAERANVDRLYLTHFSQRFTHDQLSSIHFKGSPCVVFNEKVLINV